MPVKLKRLYAVLRQGRRPIMLAALVVLALIVLMIRGLNARLRPVLEAAASSRAAGLMTQAIDAAVDDCLQENGMSYSDFVTLERDAAGRVTSITSNTTANSRFKRLVTESIAQRLSGGCRWARSPGSRCCWGRGRQFGPGWTRWGMWRRITPIPSPLPG